MNVNRVFAVSPYLEVAARNLYWRSEFLVRKVTSLRAAKKSAEKTQPPARVSIDRVVEHLAHCGVGPGDILVVHSTYSAISTGSKPRAVVEALKALVGATGTLVMPAIPRFAEAPKGTKRISADVSALVLDYDPERTRAWTGVLPAEMMKIPGARRSSHPLNSVVAWGPHTDDMLRDNLTGERPLPCGPGSSWNYCRERGATIAALGVDMAHNVTMIHVAEDMLGDRWSVPGWYRDRRFRIKTAHGWEEHTVRERHPRWAMHYAERTLDKDLRREGILKVDLVEGVPIGLLDAKLLVDYLNRRNSTGYPYYLVPRRR